MSGKVDLGPAHWAALVIGFVTGVLSTILVWVIAAELRNNSGTRNLDDRWW